MTQNLTTWPEAAARPVPAVPLCAVPFIFLPDFIIDVYMHRIYSFRMFKRKPHGNPAEKRGVGADVVIAWRDGIRMKCANKSVTLCTPIEGKGIESYNLTKGKFASDKINTHT